MNKIFLYLLCINVITLAMESPIATPPNRFFLRDLMKNYQERKPLDLASKSPQTLIEIKNWIDYARNNENARANFAREFQSTSDEIEFVLEILNAEIQAIQTPVIAQSQQPILKPAPRPLPAVPVIAKPAGRKLPPIPQQSQKMANRPLPPTPSAPLIKQNTTSLLHDLRSKKGAIQKEDKNFVQVKTVDQVQLGQKIGPATCPVQALRNTLYLLRFAKTGIPGFLSLIDDLHDAREFLENVEKCGESTQWLTSLELQRIISKMPEIGTHLNSITVLDMPQELLRNPERLKKIQDEFKQFSAAHGFIVGSRDVRQFTGEQDHYFSLVLTKISDGYLFLITDTSGADHLDPNSYNYKRVRYIADLITKGKSDIDLENELYKLSADRYGDMMARALIRGEGFNYKSLSKEELQGLEKTLPLIEKNKDEWKNRTRLDDKQLAYAVLVVKQKIQERLKQLQRK
ncbi:MAG: hypothetical protein AMXMBFR12_03350 [Candidatus Babeliales bacterium]